MTANVATGRDVRRSISHMSAGTPRPPLDPVLQKALDATPFDLAPELGVEESRRRLHALRNQAVLPELQAVRTVNRHIDGPAGPIPIRIYWPEQSETALPPLTMYFHGGGFAVGDLDSHDSQARQHAIRGSTAVVSVDYRLAPEHPFPAGLDDCWAATQWAAANGAALEADISRFAVAGDSAGGNLAAAVAQMARDNGGPDLVFQLLWYPPTMWDPAMPSLRINADGPVITTADLQVFYRWYAGDLDENDPPALMAPGRACDLSGLPPAYIATAGHCPLRDDGIKYAALLADAGIDVQLHNAEPLAHAFLGYFGTVPAATQAAELGYTALRTALHGM